MDSGGTSRTPFAQFDPNSSSWKTCQHSLFGEWDESPPTWPKAGMTCGGAAYELPTSVPRTAGSGGSGSPTLLPSPTARLGDQRGSDATRYKGPNSQGGRRSNLDDAVAAVVQQVPWLLPTPVANDWKAITNHTQVNGQRKASRHWGASLTDVIRVKASSGDLSSLLSGGGKRSSAATAPCPTSSDPAADDPCSPPCSPSG